MKTVNLKSMILPVVKVIDDRLPTILTIMGAAGTVATAISASKATLKAKDILDKDSSARTIAEKIKKVGPIYVPTIIIGSAAIGCIVGSNYTNLKRNAAMAGLYSAANEAVKKYQQKDQQEQKVSNQVACGPRQKTDVIRANGGDTLCYDVLSGRYFTSDMETIRKVENDINFQINHENAVSLNDFYFALGLDGIKMGYSLGWDCEEPLVIDFKSKLSSNGAPCLVLDFKYQPRTIFMSGTPW